MISRLAKLVAVSAVFVACLSFLASPATATPTITMSQTSKFNGLIIGTAPAGSQWDYIVTRMYYGSYRAGTATADATGQVIVDVRYGAMSFTHGDSYRVQIAPAGTTAWQVDTTLEADFNVSTFSVVSLPSGTVTTSTVPFTIDAAYTGYVVISYLLAQPVTSRSGQPSRTLR